MNHETRTTSILKLSIVPLILALAAGYWLFFIKDVHFFRREIKQEDRHAEIVGAKPLPVGPIKLLIKRERKACAFIDRAEIDGTQIWVYWHNQCNASAGAGKYSLKGKAPDGTTIFSEWHFMGGADIAPSESRENTFHVPLDARIGSVEICLYD